jgi:ABC-type nitrate/sulfonate/bicarbonate transport system substrate-binding protein
LRIVLASGAAVSLLVACGGNGDDEGAPPPAGEDGETGALPELTEVTAGYVSAVDQMGMPIALDVGFYDEANLDVTLAQPFPTGVDALNALQAGDIDFVQVGTPSIGAVLEGIDLVYLGNYTGSSSQLGIDETMALVSTEGSGIEADDLSTLAGLRVGVSIGSINHLYLLGVLQEAGVAVEDVEIINTAPPDMGVALETGGLDAAVVWDPWPIVITHSVEGTNEVIRGGGYIPFIGYIVAMRDFVEANPDVVEAFLTARAAADSWMRENPDEAAEAVVRWIPGTELEVAQEAMQYNVAQLDPRFSACNYLALDTLMQLLFEQGAIDATFDVNDHFAPAHILNVMEQQSDLFGDLPEIPEAAQITPDYVLDRAEAQEACSAS